MPRRKQPPRLHLYERKGRPAVWIILDSGRQISTGAREDDRRTAEEALGNYLGGKHVNDFGNGHPARVRIADAIAEYAEKHGPTTRRQALIGLAIDRMIEFFGTKTVSAVTPSACNDYVAWRTAQPDPRFRHTKPRLAKPATARRELTVLAAALAWCWKDGKLDRLVPVRLPPSPEPRERHLSRSEVAAMLYGAMGWDQDGVRHRHRINRHLARFILLGLYTGTRHDAILKLQWMANTVGGWVDLENQVLYRRPGAAVETKKRRPAIPIPGRLMPHLRRWRRLTARFVIEWHGKPIASQERRAWRQARELAGLGSEVTPHILRHSCATMLLHLGVSVYDVAGVLGTSEDVIRRTYGHHAEDQLRKAVAAFSRRAR